MTFSVDFQVSNPSPYTRTDYVQLDLDALSTAPVPNHLDETNLVLYHLDPTGNAASRVPCQVDKPFGSEGTRVLSFQAANVPNGPDDYSHASASYRLREETADSVKQPGNLWIGHYYKNQEPGEPKDGFRSTWAPTRKVNGVKLANGTLEMYVSLVQGDLSTGRSQSGAVTSLLLHEAADSCGAGEMLSPYWSAPDKSWGQISEIVLFPLPWEYKWFQRVDLLSKDYQLVWSKSGPVRATVALKSPSFTLTYDGRPYFDAVASVKCAAYRIFCVYPGPRDPYYVEDLFVLSQDAHRHSISFRPYFRSVLLPGIDLVPTNLSRLEHIPDYFMIWKHFGPIYRGYGVASDTHIRGIRIESDHVQWRLPVSFHSRVVHHFSFLGRLPEPFDPIHDIGHSWYENTYKPLEVYPYEKRFPSPVAFRSSLDSE